MFDYKQKTPQLEKNIFLTGEIFFPNWRDEISGLPSCKILV